MAGKRRNLKVEMVMVGLFQKLPGGNYCKR